MCWGGEGGVLALGWSRAKPLSSRGYQEVRLGPPCLAPSPTHSAGQCWPGPRGLPAVLLQASRALGPSHISEVP